VWRNEVIVNYRSLRAAHCNSTSGMCALAGRAAHGPDRSPGRGGPRHDISQQSGSAAPETRRPTGRDVNRFVAPSAPRIC
jgi:hypothetical protein